MDKKILFVKFSKTRKKEFSLRTTIFKDDKGKLKVEKKGDECSKNTIKNLVYTYKRIKNISKDFTVIPIKQSDEYTVEFPFVKGPTLHELATTAKTKKEFNAILSRYIKLLDSIPTKTTTLNQEFEKIFGEVDKNKEYLSLKQGILDFNLGNLIVDNKGKIYFIDYEWSYNFPIPKDFILFRALLVLHLNTPRKCFYTLEELLAKFIKDENNIDEYSRWEEFFINKVVSKNKHYQTYTVPGNYINIAELQKEVEEKREENQKLNKKIEDITSGEESLNREAEEFRTFKTTKIWKNLSIYRKLKKYSKNFFFNIRRDGPRKTFKRIFTRIKNIIKYRQELKKKSNPYIYWLKNHKITPKKRTQLKKELKNLKYKPLISIVMPVYNVDKKWIKRAVKSIKRQIYPNWELCIADDASTNQKLKKHLRRINNDKKIKVFFRKKNGHISEASNSALKLATGEFVALMDNDDIIHPHALLEVVKVLNKNKDTDLIYSDEDKIDIRERRMEPFFKPAWSPDLFMSTNYLCHLTVIRKRLIDVVEGFRKGYEGSQDYDLFLRITEITNKIAHIPDILYSWRKIPGSTAAVYSDKGYAEKASFNALTSSLERRKIDATVSKGLFPGSFRVKYKIFGSPLVSIIIPTKDKLEHFERCISSLLEKTTYKNYEVLVVDTGSEEKRTLDFYKDLVKDKRVRLLKWEKPFNYSSVNNYGVKNAKGEYVVLLNNDTEIISPDWIEGMLEHAQRKEIGAVGVKLLYPNNTIQHVGVVLGIAGPSKKESIAGHIMRSFPRDIMGIPFTKDIIRNYSAVTAACLMIKKDKFLEMNGMDGKYRIAFNDIDFGIRLYKSGYYNLYTPFVELYHHESISVGTPNDGKRDMVEFAKEVNMMINNWGEIIYRDPFYNKNLNWENTNSEINTKLQL